MINIDTKELDRAIEISFMVQSTLAKAWKDQRRIGQDEKFNLMGAMMNVTVFLSKLNTEIAKNR